MPAESVFDIKTPDAETAVKAFQSLNEGLERMLNTAKTLFDRGGVATAIAPDDAAARLMEVESEIKAVSSEITRLETGIAALGSEDFELFDTMTADAKLLQESLESLRREQETLNDALSDMNDQDMFPSFRSPGNQLGGLFSQFSQVGGYGSAFSELSMGIGQALDMGSQLGMQFGEMAEMAGESGRAINQHIAGGLNKLSKVAGVAGAAIAGVSAGFSLYDKIVGHSAKATQEAIEARRLEIDIMREANELLRSGTIDAIDEEIRALQEEITLKEAARDAALRAAVDETSMIDQVRTVAEYGLDRILGGTGKATTRYGEVAAEIDQYTREIEDAQERLANREEIRAQVGINEQARAATQRLADAEQELADLRQSAADSAARFRDSLQEYIDDFEQQRSDQLREQQRADAKALEEHNEALEDLRSDSHQRIEEMEKAHSVAMRDARNEFLEAEQEAQQRLKESIIEVEEDVQEALADLEKEMTDNRAKAVASYMESELERYEDHLESLADAEDDYQKERRRRLEDLHDDLAAAERANDVRAFLDAQKQADKDLRRMAEDHEEQRGEEQDTFDKTSIERREQFEEELATLQKEGSERVAELREQATERIAELREQAGKEKAERQRAQEERLQQMREQHKEALKAEQAQLKESLKQQKAAFEERMAEEAEERAYQEQLAQEQFDRQIAKMREQHETELAEMESREMELLRIIRSGGHEQEKVVHYTQLQMVAAHKRGAADAVRAIRREFDMLTALENTEPGGQPAPYDVYRGTGPVPTFDLTDSGDGNAVRPLEKRNRRGGQPVPNLGTPVPTPMSNGGNSVQVNLNGNVDLGGISRDEFVEYMTTWGTTIAQAFRDAQSGVNVPLSIGG